MAAIILNKQPYTCICCQVAFGKSEHQRAHYKTDWHRYNLKRQVAELPPVTALAYQEKVSAISEADAEERESKQAQFCRICRKTFSNKNSLQTHERSRKHKEMECKASTMVSSDPPLEKDKVEKQTSENTDEGEEMEEESEPLEVTECLFCPNYEDNMEANLSHMGKIHGFFIPELEYLVDLEGLIQYLGEKVGVSNMCLYCNDSGKQFRSVEAVQHHMVDKCHCKIMFEGDAALEYAEYFDYTKSYPTPSGSGKEDMSEGGTNDDQLVPTDQMLKINNDLELVLPSGAIIGHRYYKNYYKQHLPVNTKKATSVSRVMAAYRAIGWNSSCDDHMRRKRDEKWAEKMKQAKTLKTSVRANKFQTHFRPQVVF